MAPKNDEEILRNLDSAIKSLDIQTPIEIEVNKGIVTLRGTVSNPFLKEITALTAQAIPNIKAIVQHINVKSGPDATHEVIKHKVKKAFKQNLEIPAQRIEISIVNDKIILEGTVRWNYQKDAAADAVKNAVDSHEILNRIGVDSKLKDGFTKKSILKSLASDGRVNCDDLSIVINGKNIILVGTVSSSIQRELAYHLVRRIPDVGKVENALLIRPAI
ncbi:MAG: BON domain-containing protein [Flavobacterium sp.]|nr:MAG: BON domain-containing protein [Flavobacterium sp.]